MNERRVALVTGASGGIGGACALALAGAGYHVGLHYHSHEARAREALDRLVAAGGSGELVAFDAADAEAVEKGVRAFGKAHDRLDALVAAAGVTYNQMCGLTAAADLDRMWAVNARGAFLAAKSAAKFMLRTRWGRIVFVGSIVGEHGNAGQSAYAATKAALRGMGKSLARELGPRGITVNIVAPGLVDTAMIKDLTNQTQNAILQQVPMRRIGSADDIAAVVAFLCGDAAGYITGAVVPVDGGLGA